MLLYRVLLLVPLEFPRLLLLEFLLLGLLLLSTVGKAGANSEERIYILRRLLSRHPRLPLLSRVGVRLLS